MAKVKNYYWDLAEKESDAIINKYVKDEITKDDAIKKLSDVENINLCGIDEYNVDEVLDMINFLKYENFFKTKFGIAYNPYLENYYGICGEKLRFEKKISSGLTKSIWLQFGTDIKLLESELNFLKS